jgi:prepilin-type N-terminal cleavage/methylation domain-containing protein
MVFKLTGTKKQQGFTLVEFMVAAALCCLLLAGMTSLYSFTTTSFASVTTYTVQDQKSRYANDVISRDVRSAISVDDTTTASKLVLNTTSSGNVTYLYNSGAGTLVRTDSIESKQLLTNVVSLSFSLYQRPTSAAAYESLPAATPGSAKLVGFTWKCSQRIVTSRSDTQDNLAAIVELRNQ